jgi:ribonucleotide reductase alpha subunit
MPTASTSQILGNNECFEPYTSNLYTRRVLAGEFTVVNQHLVRDLQELGLWNPLVKNKIIAHGGSIQQIPEIPQDIRDLYKTVWEVSQRRLLDLAADRGAFIDQSQSLNVYIAQPTIGKLSSMHFHGWRLGLKTGMYYLRTRPAADAIKFTLDQRILKEENHTAVNGSQLPCNLTPRTSAAEQFAALACSLDKKDDCIACGS